MKLAGGGGKPKLCHLWLVCAHATLWPDRALLYLSYQLSKIANIPDSRRSPRIKYRAVRALGACDACPDVQVGYWDHDDWMVMIRPSGQDSLFCRLS